MDPHPPEVFRQNLVELARDLVIREQQIEMLISTLPGLENTAGDQERAIRELDEQLREAERQRQEAVQEKRQILTRLDKVVKSVRRP